VLNASLPITRNGTLRSLLPVFMQHCPWHSRLLYPPQAYKLILTMKAIESGQISFVKFNGK